MKIFKKSILMSSLALVSILNFSGCSNKSAEDELYSAGLSAAKETKDKGYSDFMAFRVGRRLILQIASLADETVNKYQCNTNKVSKFAKQISNSDFDFKPLFVSLSESKYCDDKKISNQEFKEYQKKALEKLAAEYDINVEDIYK